MHVVRNPDEPQRGELAVGSRADGTAVEAMAALDLKTGAQRQRDEVIGTIIARSEHAARAGEHAVLGGLGWSPGPGRRAGPSYAMSFRAPRPVLLEPSAVAMGTNGSFTRDQKGVRVCPT